MHCPWSGMSKCGGPGRRCSEVTVAADEAGGRGVVFKSRLRFPARLVPLGIERRAHDHAMSDRPASWACQGGFPKKADRDGFVRSSRKRDAALRIPQKSGLHICSSEFPYVKDLGFGRIYGT